VHTPGDLLQQATYGQAVTSLKYDLAGRILQMNDADLGEYLYDHDAVGNPVTQVDAKDQTLWLKYDVLTGPLKKRLGGASSALLASYIYDKGGERAGRKGDGIGLAATACDPDNESNGQGCTPKYRCVQQQHGNTHGSLSRISSCRREMVAARPGGRAPPPWLHNYASVMARSGSRRRSRRRPSGSTATPGFRR
jgi:uncharacterized protein RhaS with RHS repeats